MVSALLIQSTKPSNAIRYVYVLMTKQVQLSDAAYKLLSSRKRPGESFSDAVTRLAMDQKDPGAFIGGRRSDLSLPEHLDLARRVKGPVL